MNTQERMQALLTLISEDRAEIREARSYISTLSVTFLSVILGILAAARGREAILNPAKSAFLCFVLILVYSIFARNQWIALRDTRKALNRREVLLLGSDVKGQPKYSADQIELLYEKPEEYNIDKHKAQPLGDDKFLNMILGTVLVSMLLTGIAYIL